MSDVWARTSAKKAAARVRIAPATRPRGVLEMTSWDVSHLPDHALLAEVTRLLSHERGHTAALLAHLAEVETRRLYAIPGYHSMHEWCVGELHLSRDAAYRRIRAARAARKFPALLAAVAEGRLHLTAVGLLDPWLTPANFDELVASATHLDREAIELMLAHRYPRSDEPTEVRPLVAAAAVAPAMALATLALQSDHLCDTQASECGSSAPTIQPVTDASGKVALAPLAPNVATQAAPPVTPTSLTPIVYTTITPHSPGRYKLKGMLSQSGLDLLREAKDLLAHEVRSGDLMHVLERVVEEWVAVCRRRRYAATDKPRRRRSAGNGRYIPAEVQRAVRKRDGDRCTYLSPKGRRCARCTKLQFDHIVPVARGGRTTVENLRLRCRTHNQLEAEQVFGRQFMREKREAAKVSQTTRVDRASQAAQVTQQTPPPAP